MFDAVMFSGADPEPAARTLSGLVEGVVEGIIGRVLVVCEHSSPELERLADASGCRLEQGIVPDQLAGVLAGHLETSHVLAFEAGALLPAGWPSLLALEFQRRGQPGTAVSLAFRPEILVDRLKLMFAISTRGRVPLLHGALLPKARLTDSVYLGGPVKTFGPIHMTQMSMGRMI
jgi:hypothetical protein